MVGESLGRVIGRLRDSPTIYHIAPEGANDGSGTDDGSVANDGLNPQVRRLMRVGRRKPPARYMADPRFGNILSIEDPTAPFTVLHGPRQTPVLASMTRIKQSDCRFQAQLDRRISEYEEFTLNTIDWGENLQVKDCLVSEIGSFFTLSHEATPFDLSDNITMKDMLVDCIDPSALLAKTSTSSVDNLTWEQVMKGHFAEDNWKAAEVEFETLENIRAWTVVEQDEAQNILPGTWAFKCK